MGASPGCGRAVFATAELASVRRSAAPWNAAPMEKSTGSLVDFRDLRVSAKALSVIAFVLHFAIGVRVLVIK